MKLIVKTLSVMSVFAIGTFQMAFAAEGDLAAAGANAEVLKYLAVASALGLGAAAFGCGMGQGKMVAAAMDGISRNPKAAGQMFVPMILGLAFIEALTIYALIFVFIFKAAVL